MADRPYDYSAASRHRARDSQKHKNGRAWAPGSTDLSHSLSLPAASDVHHGPSVRPLQDVVAHGPCCSLGIPSKRPAEFHGDVRQECNWTSRCAWALLRIWPPDFLGGRWKLQEDSCMWCRMAGTVLLLQVLRRMYYRT